jgi:hypothetical protein
MLFSLLLLCAGAASALAAEMVLVFRALRRRGRAWSAAVVVLICSLLGGYLVLMAHQVWLGYQGTLYGTWDKGLCLYVANSEYEAVQSVRVAAVVLAVGLAGLLLLWRRPVRR